MLGPLDKYPVRPGAAYQMPTATWEAALRVHKTLGIERGIIVQTTTYGADHSVVLDGSRGDGAELSRLRQRAGVCRGDDAYLAKLHDAGVRGARFSFRQELGAVLSDKDFARAIARIRELGWYAKIQPEKDGIVSSVAKYESLHVPVLIDHMARPGPGTRQGRSEPAEDARALSKGNFWVMLSLGEKISKNGPPWDDVIPVARAYIEAAPERCVWASDWPHPVSVVQPPNDADLLELLYRYAPDEAELKKILVTNPAKLFGYEN